MKAQVFIFTVSILVTFADLTNGARLYDKPTDSQYLPFEMDKELTEFHSIKKREAEKTIEDNDLAGEKLRNELTQLTSIALEKKDEIVPESNNLEDQKPILDSNEQEKELDENEKHKTASVDIEQPEKVELSNKNGGESNDGQFLVIPVSYLKKELHIKSLKDIFMNAMTRDDSLLNAPDDDLLNRMLDAEYEWKQRENYGPFFESGGRELGNKEQAAQELKETKIDDKDGPMESFDSQVNKSSSKTTPKTSTTTTTTTTIASTTTTKDDILDIEQELDKIELDLSKLKSDIRDFRKIE